MSKHSHTGNVHLEMAGEIDLSRRSFLKAGFAGSIVLGSTSLVAGLAGCAKSEHAAASGYRFLRDADLALFAALIPVVLDGMLPEQQAARDAQTTETLLRIDGACLYLGPPAQAELYRMFDLLNLRPTRYLTTGVLSPWQKADAADVDAFLKRWRNSSLGMFNAGYRVLVKLVTTSYFSMSASWPSAGYPGPLDWVYKAVNS